MAVADDNAKRKRKPGAGGSAHVLADQSQVINFLSSPGSHGLAGGEAVRRIDTHGAMVFLAGERVYKIKRAVRYPYLDFSTLEKRHAACEREVRFNRRSAPDLYLGVVPVTKGSAGMALGGDGEIVEWAIVMRRFGDDALLADCAARGDLTLTICREVAEKVVSLHRTAEVVREFGGVPESERMARIAAMNMEEFREWPALFPASDIARLESATHQALEGVAGLLDSRGIDGFVRHCHGDLHLRNIYRDDAGHPVLFDCLEFDDDLACIDTWYDLAFLLMDIDQRGLRGHANAVLNSYLWLTQDVDGLALVPLFMSVRAAIRAKTSASAASTQDEAKKRAVMERRARHYFAVARDYLDAAPSRLVAIGGLSGTGKTTVARELAPHIGRAPGAVHLRTDLIRKRLYGAGESERLPEAAYTQAAGEPVYAEMERLAGEVLARGQSVVVDAVFSKPEERDAARAVADAHDVPFSGLWLEASAEVLMARVAARHGDASDAMVDVVRKQLGYKTGAIEWERLDAAGSPDDVLRGALAVAAPG